jgi:hypothetical protein
MPARAKDLLLGYRTPERRKLARIRHEAGNAVPRHPRARNAWTDNLSTSPWIVDGAVTERWPIAPSKQDAGYPDCGRLALRFDRFKAAA